MLSNTEHRGRTLDLSEVYRDPVHDFGLFQFDATELRFTPPTAISVAPSELPLGCDEHELLSPCLRNLFQTTLAIKNHP